MIKNSFIYISKISLVVIFLTLSFFQKELYGARETGLERVRECKENLADNFSYVERFDPPISAGRISKEMDYNPSNPYCIANFLILYASIKGAIAGVNLICGSGSPFPRVAPSLTQDMYELTKAGYTASHSQPGALCPRAFGAGLATITGVLGVSILSIYATAEDHYKSVKVCGSDWKTGDPIQYKMVSGHNGSYAKRVLDCVNDKDKCGKISAIDTAINREDDEAKMYREWFFGGKEFEDAPNEGDSCQDPTREGKPQRYYHRGLSANFMCEKYNPAFLTNDKKEIYTKAYKCCLNRSQNYICLEKGQIGGIAGGHVFCKGDSKCTFKNNLAVVFETYRRDHGRLICAQSYSLCPYNFAVGGGTIYADYFQDVDKDKKMITPDLISKATTDTKACQGAESREDDCKFNGKLGNLKNYCQYFAHCSSASNKTYVSNFEILNPYYSKACIDFVGDSQNGVQKVIDSKTGVSYNGGLLFGNQTNFSAPIVQCFKETMGNIFTNRAGHSKCLDGSFGNSNNECKDSDGQDTYLTIDTFVYKKGNKVKENSLFEFLQKRLKGIITAVLVISITFFGFKILLGKLDLANKKELLVYIIKISFVIYFVNGTAWKDVFFDGIYNGSSEISKMFFKIKSSSDTTLCNFGSQYDADGLKIASSVSYPRGSEYLMVWDTLDCKIMQYLNYRPGFSSSSIFLLIIAAFFTGGIGLILSFSVLIMAVCLITAVIRAMHIFISSAIAIIIYIFVSPIIIPLVLFERTKSIFDAWLSHLMSFTLSPIVLFAYLAIFISLSEDIIFGGAKGFKDGVVDCSKYCINNAGLKIDENKCDAEKKTEVINPLDHSVACIFNFNSFQKESGFALFGIGLPSLGVLLEEGKVELRVFLVLKTALFLFILAQFMDEIPSIISRLTGESIDVKGVGYFEIMKKFTSTVRGIQKRGARLAKSSISSNIKDAKKGASKDKGGGSDKGGNENSSGGGDSAGGGGGGDGDSN